MKQFFKDLKPILFNRYWDYLLIGIIIGLILAILIAPYYYLNAEEIKKINIENQCIMNGI